MKKFFLLLFSISLINSCSSGSEEPPPPPIKYTLTTAANPTAGGTVTPASGQHNEDATVNITATPAGEYIFSSWTGATGTTASTSVVMNSNKTVTANFIKKKYALTITVEGEGIVAEKVIKAGAATDYNSGTVVELTATPSTGWGFKEWQGDVTGTENPVQITIDGPKTVKVKFENNEPIAYIAQNGVTIKATSNAKVGDTITINGTKYTVVDYESLINNTYGTDYSKFITTKLTSTGSFSFSAEFNDDISHWDVSNITIFNNGNCQSLFENASAFNQDISKWDVSKVTNMCNMFKGATSFNQDIGEWDVGNVTYAGGMFRDATAFNQDIGSWNVSNVTNMRDMFYNAIAFNKDIGSWDVSNVTIMGAMFRDASSFHQDIGSWNVGNVTDMTYMFNNAQEFNQDLTKWCVTNIASEPQDFSVSSALSEANKPIWGTCPSSGSNIWTGTNMTFTKGDQSDPTLESNQDRITDNVWITRPNKKEDGKNGYGQIYNIKEESKPDENNSPVGTKWAVGTIDQIGALTFKKFRAAVGKPKNVVGKNLVMYLEKDDVYLTVKFTSWSQGEKGGFAYERSTKP